MKGLFLSRFRDAASSPAAGSVPSGGVLAIRDTPQAVAGGIAIGIFFGLTPLIGVKTLLSLFFAWLTGCNLVAAVVSCSLHDIALPLMPLLYLWQYDLGCWLLSHPHEFPPSLVHLHLGGHAWRSWTTFLTIGRPLLAGSLLCATPMALISYLVTRFIIVRYRRKHPNQP